MTDIKCNWLEEFQVIQVNQTRTVFIAVKYHFQIMNYCAAYSYCRNEVLWLWRDYSIRISGLAGTEWAFYFVSLSNGLGHSGLDIRRRRVLRWTSKRFAVRTDFQVSNGQTTNHSQGRRPTDNICIISFPCKEPLRVRPIILSKKQNFLERKKLEFNISSDVKVPHLAQGAVHCMQWRAT